MKIRENFPTYKEVILFLIGLSSQFVCQMAKALIEPAVFDPS